MPLPRIVVFLLAALLLLSAGPARAGECPATPDPGPAARPVPVHGKRVGLALGSGSMHGLAHIGVIQALEAAGVEVKVVSGTSVGALVGALWASGMSGTEIQKFALQRDWDNTGDFSFSWEGIMSNTRLRGQLEPIIGRRKIEAWPRRFGAVATNLADGHRRLLMSGDGALAVQASSAVPVLYAPVVINGERLGDGALVEPVPVDAARDLGAQFVIGVDVAYRPYEEAAGGLTGNAFQAMHILINALAARQLRDADYALRLDLHHQFTACGREALIAAGRQAMRRAMPELAAALARK